jgi:hypothetical protein
VAHDHAQQDDHHQREERAHEKQPGGVFDPGQQQPQHVGQQQVVELPDDPRGRPDRDADRSEYQDPRDEVAPKGFAKVG